MYIKVRAITNAKKEQIKQVKQDFFEIWLKEKPEKNLANKKILEILFSHFQTKNIKIINGAHHPIKLLKIEEESSK